jgi:hypothetical protein
MIGFLKKRWETEKYLKKYGPKLAKLNESYKLTNPRSLSNPSYKECKE